MVQQGASIDGVIVTQLKKIPDERGAIFHVMRCDDPVFQQFGEVYISKVHPGAIKAWHLHKKMTLNYAVPVGKIKLVVYDDRQGSATRGNLMELFIGDENYNRVTIPPGVYNGFKGIGTVDALVVNCATHPHEADEITRIDPYDPRIGYDWSIKNG